MTRNIEVGASGFSLEAGDLLLSTVGTSIFISGSTPSDVGFASSITVANEDVFVFRPDTPGDYTAGTFAMLLDDPTAPDTGIGRAPLIDLGAQEYLVEDLIFADGFEEPVI